MPTIEVNYSELETLLGIELHDNMERLDEILSYVKSEVKYFNKQENIVNVEIKDTNRPDLWSVEGLARGLRSYLKIEKGPRNYFVNKSIVEINVAPTIKNIRPYIGCSVIKEIELTDNIIRGFMHLQDKLDQTYGRSRQKTSIGLYDFDQISVPLSYIAVKPSDFSFIPLGFEEKMTLSEILEKHPKGIEYGHIVQKNDTYPLLIDSKQKVLSFPPVINSNDLGRVTEKTRNLLIEVTGTMYQTTINTLNLVTLALIDRGGKAYSATVNYPKDKFYGFRKIVTPIFKSKTVRLDIEYSRKVLGLDLKAQKIADLLLIAGLGIEKINKSSVDVLVPCYRVDVMHQIDLIEDVAVAYGYNNIEPLWRDLPTTGSMLPNQHLKDVARELMVGLGYQETLNYNLTSQEKLFEKMNFERQEVVELVNPKIVTMACLRNWLLPSLLEFLGNNQSVEFPQKIFELGKVTLLDDFSETFTRDEYWLAGITTHPSASFTEVKSVLASFFMNLGVDWFLKKTSHSSFIEGRVGKIIVDKKEVGVIGEINPKVLETWNLENPAAAFEVNLHKILFSNS